MTRGLAIANKLFQRITRGANHPLFAALCLSLLVIGSLTPAKEASADDSLQIAIIGDSNNANQRLLSEKAKETLSELGLNLKIDSISSSPFIKSNGCGNDYDLIIPVGNDISTKLIEGQCQLPMLSVLTPSFGYFKIPPNEARLSSIFLDQPASRYLKMVKAISPAIRNISLLYSDYSEPFYQQIVRAAESSQLIVNAKKIDNDSNLYRTLEQVTEEGDVLLAVPDPYVYNRKTIKAIFLASYQNGVPIIGFSEAYTKAGAIASIHSDIEHIAKQLAEGIYFFYQNDNQLPKASYPKYFDVSTNSKVASSLGFNIMSAEGIKKSIREVD